MVVECVDAIKVKEMALFHTLEQTVARKKQYRSSALTIKEPTWLLVKLELGKNP